MSGRDCIGIAKTGSGKTLAFVLPMLRHVKDQPPLAQGDGPVALSMAPTRELVTQVRCRRPGAAPAPRLHGAPRGRLLHAERHARCAAGGIHCSRPPAPALSLTQTKRAGIEALWRHAGHSPLFPPLGV